jgi:hypothetical protein
MPFVQMENISHFLRACQSPPLNLQPHDVFLTVDLYEKKDPAQVLQCLSAFSRVAHQVQPSRFNSAIGPKAKGGVVSPQGTGTLSPNVGTRGRGFSNASNGSAYTASRLSPTPTGSSNSGRWSPNKSTNAPLSPGVSSWSKKVDEGATSPAWNIAQYGYMGGASQGNMGISFGGRRQITSAGPHVPSLAEKEKRRREEETEKERLKAVADEAEARRAKEREEEEEAARIAEEERWAEETRKEREKIRHEAEEEKRKWEEEEQRWKQEEEARQREEHEAEVKLERERRRTRGNSEVRLQGQFLSQYQAENGISRSSVHNEPTSRVKELERELELARERERQYELERQDRMSAQGHQVLEDHDLQQRMKEESGSKARARSRSRPRLPSRDADDEAWRKDEREYLRQQWASQHTSEPEVSKSNRPLPQPTSPARVRTNTAGSSSRPLPDPATYTSPQAQPNRNEYFEKQMASPPSPAQSRTDRYLSSNPAPQAVQPKTTYANELGNFDSTAERDAEDRRRAAAQTKTKAGGWASKSLLEREMELERQRQQEWEEGQKDVERRKTGGEGVDGIGGGIGGKWDVNQWTGYTGGDGGNRGNLGIGAGRRQIVGPRPPPAGR